LQLKILSENNLSDPILERIEHELQLLNVNMAEANDIAMLSAFSPFPANLENVSRDALNLLRAKILERARTRADL